MGRSNSKGVKVIQALKKQKGIEMGLWGLNGSKGSVGINVKGIKGSIGV